jgi:hypothetical protein
MEFKEEFRQLRQHARERSIRREPVDITCD